MPDTSPEPMRFPYHPDYGVLDQWREEAVTIARTQGVPTAAATTGFHTSTIYRWVRDSKTDAAKSGSTNPTSRGNHKGDQEGLIGLERHGNIPS